MGSVQNCAACAGDDDAGATAANALLPAATAAAAAADAADAAADAAEAADAGTDADWAQESALRRAGDWVSDAASGRSAAGRKLSRDDGGEDDENSAVVSEALSVPLLLTAEVTESDDGDEGVFAIAAETVGAVGAAGPVKEVGPVDREPVDTVDTVGTVGTECHQRRTGGSSGTL